MSQPVELIVDGRETKVAHELRALDATFTTRELSPGDVIFVRGDDLLLMCERKTYSDLSASIADGRFSQQRESMKETGTKVLYIIEGANQPRSELDSRRVLGALENLAIVHGISVLPTRSTAETALALQHIQKKLSAQPERKEGEAVVQKIIRRKDQIMANVLLHQLQVVTGVSMDVAKAIVAVYPTMRDLVLAYESLKEEDTRKTLLQDLPVNKRRVGPAVSQRIYQALYGAL